QHSGVHEQVVAELFRLGARRDGYTTLQESERRRWLLEELLLPRLLRSPHVSYSPETEKELHLFAAAAELQRRYGCDALPAYIISASADASDILEAALLLKEAGLMRPGSQSQLSMNIVPLFETIAGLRECTRVMDELMSLPFYRQLLADRNDVQEIMVGFRQQQGGRLPHVELGALQSGARVGEIVSPPWRQATFLSWPGRHRRPRRWAQLRGDPGAATGQLGRADPYHRAR